MVCLIISLEKYKKLIHDDFSKSADFINKIIKTLNLTKNSKVLDIGTGFGAMAILLAINGLKVITGQPEGAPEWDQHRENHEEHQSMHQHEKHELRDHEEYSVEWEENAKVVGVEDQIKFQHLTVQNLPFPDNYFDAIFMYDTLQHVKNKQTALNDCIRVIKPSGLICVIEWNKKSIEADYKKHGFKIDYIDPKDFLKQKDTLIETHLGKYVNLFIIRKI